VPIADSTTTWVAIGSIATFLTAIGGAVAAVASWRSAGASLSASEDAREALAMVTAPSVAVRTVFEGQVLEEFRWFLEITEGPAPGATDVKVEIRYTDGAVARDQRSRLPAPSLVRTTDYPLGQLTTAAFATESPWRVAITDVRPIAGPSVNAGVAERVESVVVTYWDARRIAEWELSMATVNGVGDAINSAFGWVRRLR
jgi:hypothetical protein